MKALLFGTGDYYRKYREWFRPEDILGLVDNDEGKSGTRIDGYRVYLPHEAVSLPYDCVVILSVHEEAMRRQLTELGVPEDKIYIYSELYKHPEMTAADREICFWGSDKRFSGILKEDFSDAVLLMSHNLDLNGAALALFYMAQILVKKGFFILFVSWSDGALRQHLCEHNIPAIIDPNLQMKTQREAEWTHGFHRIICNTLNYYQFLSDRNMGDKVIWWLHDPLMFYKSLDKELMHRIRKENLEVYAVSPIAEAAFRRYFPDFDVKQLKYGIPDVLLEKQRHEKLKFIVIGNVQAYKGQDILIQALKVLDKKSREHICVEIVGFRPSAYANAVKEAAESIRDTIHFIPPVDRGEIHRLLDEADVLVCPSIEDTMSIATNEGMQHCLPCIVSDTAGVAAYIEDGVNGFVVGHGDAGMLADRIRWCIEHRDRLEQMGKNARKIYEKHFSMEVFEENLTELVHALM
ncbi:MAG: glycosyltransferase [Lachnospiraceae bacterium]|nr:glycosyltransferase [Lachnospiraceae bacterium]